MHQEIDILAETMAVEAGKIITVAQAISLTDDFTVEMDGRSHVTFAVSDLAGLITDSNSEFISFRYCKIGNHTSLVALPLQKAPLNGFPGLLADASLPVSDSDLLKLTNDLTFEVNGIRAHVFRSELVMRIIAWSDNLVRVFFGMNKSAPVLVITPDNLYKYGLSAEVCLNFGQVCPPFCR